MFVILCFFTKRVDGGEVVFDDRGVSEPDATEKLALDKEYAGWKYVTAIVTLVALGVYIIPMFYF